MLLSEIVNKGYDLHDTFELVDAEVEFEDTKISDMFAKFGLDINMASEFLVAVRNLKCKQIGPYDTSKYFEAFDLTNIAYIQFESDNINTRRSVVQFPKEHCFESVQFIHRDGVLHVICNMRSCNAIDNLLFDAYICLCMAHIIRWKLSKKTTSVTLHMHFGSLHVFKKVMTE